MRAIVLSIGDELTLGQTLDTNSQWLSARLLERSIIVIEHRTIADDRSALAAAIRDAVARCDVLITTGGLGPTDDDLTREALSDAISPGEALLEDAQAREHLQNWFTKRGRAMPSMNLRQAQRPRTFKCLANPNGTAPGLSGALDRCAVYCLPGPPREMQPMFGNFVAPALPSAQAVVLTSQVQEFGMGESVAAEKLGDLMQRDRNPLVGTTASQSIVSARIRVEGPVDTARQQLDQTLQRIRQAWQPYAFADDDRSLADVVGEMLLERGLKLATAESCTGGWLGKAIVDRSGSSAYYLGGWVTYSNEMKMSQLGVPRELLDRHGAVSAEVAQAMAEGALRASGADCALSITGIAGPDGGSQEKPVGTVFIACAMHGGPGVSPERVGAVPVVVTRTGETPVPPTQVRRFEFPGEREVIRDRSVKAALQMLRFALLSVSETPLIWEATRQQLAGGLRQAST